jgi:hypothetical protein
MLVPLPPVQVGGVTIAGTLSPHSVNWLLDREETMTLRFSAGAAPQELQVVVSKPLLRSVAMGATRIEASPLATDGDAQVSGLTEYRPVSVLTGRPACLAYHGSEPVSRNYVIALAPSTSASMVFKFRIAPLAPWPTSDLRPVVTVNPASAGTSIVTRGTAIPFARVPIHGPTGTRITLDSSPRISPMALQRPRSIRRGRTIVFRGRTSPPLRRRRVRLRFLGQSHRPRTVSTLTDTAGRFEYRWTPKAADSYEVAVLTPAVGRHVRADFMCPVGVRVRR